MIGGAYTFIYNSMITSNRLGDPTGQWGGIYDQGLSGKHSYNNFYGNDYFDCYPGWWLGASGNISVDPEYLDTASVDTLDWDFHVETTSSCVDAGDPSILDPDGGASDIGAYGGPDAEFWDLDYDGYYEWWQPGAYDFGAYPGMNLDCDDQDDTVYPGNGC